MTVASLQVRLILALAPELGIDGANIRANLDDEQAAKLNATTTITSCILPILGALGIKDANDVETTLKDDLETAQNLISHAIDLVEGRKVEARGDLDNVLAEIEAANSNLEDITEEIGCDTCGEFNNDGEGFDGLCGSCADKAETDDEDQDNEFPRITEDHPTPGDRVAMAWDDEVQIYVEDVLTTQSYLAQNIWEISDGNGDLHLIEDEGDRWETVTPTRPDIEANPNRKYGALYVEDGVDRGDGLGELNWRGQFIKDGSPAASTDLLYPTIQEACIAALDLDPEIDAIT